MYLTLLLLFAVQTLQPPFPTSRTYMTLVGASPTTPAVHLKASNFPATLGTCQVHGVPLTPTDISVGYGHDFRMPPSEQEVALEYAELVHFPNAIHPVSAGYCTKGPEDPDTKVQFVCQSCQEARLAWLRSTSKH